MAQSRPVHVRPDSDSVIGFRQKRRRCEEPTAVETWWSQIKMLGMGRRNESISQLFHVTSDQNKLQIQEDGMLKARVMAGIAGQSDDYYSEAPLAKSNIKGVWFMASLFQGRLPDQSPYGDQRVKIPLRKLCSDVDDWKLFFESAYYFETKKPQYIRLVLVKSNDTDSIKWLAENTKQLDIKTNNVFKIDTAGASIMANQPEPYVYIEVLVVGDIDLSGVGACYDKIKDIGRGYGHPVMGVNISNKEHYYDCDY